MRPAFLLFLFSLSDCLAYAQAIDTTSKLKTVLRDTINIYGYVVDMDNHPLKAMVRSNPPKQWLMGMQLERFTDSAGRFELNGIKPSDTIYVWSSIGSVQMTNNGARFIKLIVPKYLSNFSGNNITITSKRTHPKKVPLLVVPSVKSSGGSFIDYEEPASPVSGMLRFFDLVKSQMHYTAKAVDANIEGRVTVAFSVDVDGSISRIEILRGLGYGLDEQLVNAIQKSGKWHPELFLGKPVTSRQDFSVDFNLTDK